MRWLPVVILAAACGHGSSGLKLKLIDASVQHPSNIAVYFTVDTAGGQPVPGLTADKFRIYEDNGPVSLLESKQTILNPEVAAAHYTLLLVDMSGSVAESEDLPVVIAAAQAFTDRVEKVQKVAVYTFDGSPDIHVASGFGSGRGAAAAIQRLDSSRARDPLTNLNGAVVAAIDTLHRQMAGSNVPLTFGTLVVFTDGTDRAHRVEREKLREAVAQADVELIVIGVGSEIDDGELRAIGRDGAILSKDRKDITTSFEAAAARVEAYSKRYYLLGYCSPARAGAHDLTISTTVDGKSGTLQYHFDARGFGPECNPEQKPAFSLRQTTPARQPTKAGAPPPRSADAPPGHF